MWFGSLRHPVALDGAFVSEESKDFMEILVLYSSETKKTMSNSGWKSPSPFKWHLFRGHVANGCFVSSEKAHQNPRLSVGKPTRRTWSPFPFQARSREKESGEKCVVMSPYQLWKIRVAWGKSGWFSISIISWIPSPQMIWFQLVGHEHHFLGRFTTTAWSHIAQGRALGSGAKVHGWGDGFLVGEGLKDHWRNWMI